MTSIRYLQSRLSAERKKREQFLDNCKLLFQHHPCTIAHSRGNACCVNICIEGANRYTATFYFDNHFHENISDNV